MQTSKVRDFPTSCSAKLPVCAKSTEHHIRCASFPALSPRAQSVVYDDPKTKVEYQLNMENAQEKQVREIMRVVSSLYTSTVLDT